MERGAEDLEFVTIEGLVAYGEALARRAPTVDEIGRAHV